MTKPRHMLLIIAVYCVVCVSAALYLQHYQKIAPCSLCVLQRYVFLLIAVCCLVGWLLPAPRVPAFFGLAVSLVGAGIGAWQMWTSATPSLTCGSDAIQEVLNHFVTSKWFPSLFMVKGSCVQEKVILGLTTPQWAVAAFVLISLVFVRIIFQTKRRRGRA